MLLGLILRMGPRNFCPVLYYHTLESSEILEILLRKNLRRCSWLRGRDLDGKTG